MTSFASHRHSGSRAPRGLLPILGELYDGSGQLYVDADSLSKHALIAGSTGSGKTTIVLELLRQLWTGLPPDNDGQPQRIPFLVIEPINADANDYRRLAALPGFSQLEIFTVGDERFRPLRFNPFAVPDGVLVGEHMAALMECFKAAFGLWDPLPAIYDEAITDTYLTHGILPGEVAGEIPSRAWPTVVHFRRAMDRATTDLGYAGEVRANIEAASVIRAKQLVHGPCASTFRTHLPLDLPRLMSRPAILELKTLGNGDDQALMIALLLIAITEHYKAARGAQPRLQHVTVIEEAHRLLARAKGAATTSIQAQAREKAAEAFANVLAENRKYGEGILIAEQIPSKLVEDAVKNTNLKVMCRLTSEQERTYLGEAMAMTPEQQLHAARLQLGEAFAASDELPHATEIAIQPTITTPAPEQLPQDRLPPMPGCEVCREPCNYRATGLALSRRDPLAKVAHDAIALLGPPKPTDPAKQRTRKQRKAMLPRRLAHAALQAAQAFPILPDDAARRAAATCGIVHALDGETSLSWTRLTAAEIHGNNRQNAPV